MYQKKPTSIDRSIVDAAKTTSPEPVLRHFYGGLVKVSRSGRSISVEKVLRCDCTSDGTWIACTWIGSGIGDNIKLAQFCGINGFQEAVMALTGQNPIVEGEILPQVRKNTRRSSHSFTPEKEASINIPDFIKDPREGRKYLEGRGISLDIIQQCERAGSLAYTKDGVAFIGRNAYNTIMYIAHRYYRDMPVPNQEGSFRNKKDEVNSSKIYCFNMQSDSLKNGYTAYLVEGAINAMALMDMCKEKGEAAFIQTTGNVSNREWMGNRQTIEKLRAASKVIMYAENESLGKFMTAEEKQHHTDLARKAVSEDLRTRHGIVVEMVYPEAQYGDIADYWLDVKKKRGAEPPVITENTRAQPTVTRPVVRRVVAPPPGLRAHFPGDDGP